MGAIELLIWALICILLLVLIYLILGWAGIGEQMRRIIVVILGLIVLLILLARSGFISTIRAAPP